MARGQRKMDEMQEGGQGGWKSAAEDKQMIDCPRNTGTKKNQLNLLLRRLDTEPLKRLGSQTLGELAFGFVTLLAAQPSATNSAPCSIGDYGLKPAAQNASGFASRAM